MWSIHVAPAKLRLLLDNAWDRKKTDRYISTLLIIPILYSLNIKSNEVLQSFDLPLIDQTIAIAGLILSTIYTFGSWSAKLDAFSRDLNEKAAISLTARPSTSLGQPHNPYRELGERTSSAERQRRELILLNYIYYILRFAPTIIYTLSIGLFLAAPQGPIWPFLLLCAPSITVFDFAAWHYVKQSRHTSKWWIAAASAFLILGVSVWPALLAGDLTSYVVCGALSLSFLFCGIFTATNIRLLNAAFTGLITR